MRVDMARVDGNHVGKPKKKTSTEPPSPHRGVADTVVRRETPPNDLDAFNK